MTDYEFEKLVSNENSMSNSILSHKAHEYSSNNDRLSNFKNCAGLRATNPVDALIGMLVKHFESVSTMAKNPTSYTLEKWDEKLRDIRNYTYLCRGLLIDMRAPEQIVESGTIVFKEQKYPLNQQDPRTGGN